ncbi:ABC transporter substrate-binding protein [Thermodesulfobacteriota bacterium]
MRIICYRRLLAVMALSLLSVMWGTGEVLSGEPYNLGVALGLTGSGATYSEDGVDAIRLAVEAINSKGGFLGKHPVKLFVRDTKTKPDEAVRQTEELIKTDRVRAVLGTYSSACALAIKPICREAKVLHIAAISNSEDITRKDFSPYTFSVVPNTYMQAKAVALGVAKLAKEKGWITYCTIASDYAWGRSAQENTVRQLKELAPRLKLIRSYWPPLGEKRFDGFVMGVLAHKPDCLIGFLAGSDNAAWIKWAEKYELFRRVPYPGSLVSVTELVAGAETLPRGMIGLTRAPFFCCQDVPMMSDFVKKFRAKYKRYPSDWAVLEYDAVYALKQGIEKAGNIDSDKVKDAMKGMTVETCRGDLFFRKIDNQLSCSSYLGVVNDSSEYPFPIYSPLWEIKGPESWRPEEEIVGARKNRTN